MPLRHRLLSAIALGTGLLGVAAAVMLRPTIPASSAPNGVTAPHGLQGAARHAWHVRLLGHKRLIDRLDKAFGATTQPTTQQFDAASTFVETLEGATVTVRPLGSVVSDERFVEMSVQVKDGSGQADSGQTERLGVHYFDGRWQLSRINVYGFDD